MPAATNYVASRTPSNAFGFPLDPNFAEAYFVRALVKLRSNKVMSAASDANRSANLFQAEGNLERYQDCLDLIKEIWLPSQAK